MSTTDTDELTPCLYCGHKPTTYYVQPIRPINPHPEIRFNAECECAMQAFGVTRRQAIARWNALMSGDDQPL